MQPPDPDAGTIRTIHQDLVVVPTYNEVHNVKPLLDEITEHAPDADVLIVDDSSPDGTADVVRYDTRLGTRVFLLQRATKNGLGAAYRAGFAWALAHHYEHIVQMDADLSHPPDQLPTLLAALDRADIAVGSRYVIGGATRPWSFRRRALSRGGNAYVRFVLGLTTQDCTAGFKAFRADALRRIGVASSRSDGYCFQIENTWHAERAGLRIVEIPIIFTDRVAGTSKMSGDIVAEALSTVLKWRIGEILHHPWPAPRSTTSA